MADTMPLGSSDLRVPRLGVGAMTWGDPRGLARFSPAKLAYGGAHGLEEERSAVKTSLAAGVNLFDTAAMYSNGAAERRLGDLLTEPETTAGAVALVATKFPGSLRFRSEELPGQLEASLQRLGRSQVDLYQHHFPSERVDIPRLMDLLADAVHAGKVRAVGVSNYSAQQMRIAHAALARRGVPLASNQVNYSLMHRRPEVDGVLDACRELGVTLIAYSPMAMGALTGKYSQKTRAGGLRRWLPEFNRQSLEALQPVLALLRQIGGRYGKTPGQVAVRWLIENPLVLPIPGAKNGRQAQENAEALSFSLTPEEIDALDRATAAWKK